MLLPVPFSSDEQDELDAIALDLVGDSGNALGLGLCLSGEASAIGGANGSVCYVSTTKNHGSVFTVGISGGVGLDVGGGVIYTNASELDDLSGPGGCYSAGVMIAGGTICGGSTDGQLNGVVTVYVGAAVGLPVSQSLQWTETRVVSFGPLAVFDNNFYGFHR